MNRANMAEVQRPISVLHDTPELVQALTAEQVRQLQKVADDLAVASCAINGALERIKAHRLPIDVKGMWSSLMVCGHIGTGATDFVQQSQYEQRHVVAMDHLHARAGKR